MLDKLSKLMDDIQRWHDSTLSWLPDWLLFKWYVTTIIICVVIAAITWFVPFKWVRIIGGGVILLVIARMVGGKQMHSELKGQVEDLKEQLRAERAAKREQRGGGGLGGFFGGS